jgi:hypothetical protein
MQIKKFMKFYINYFIIIINELSKNKINKYFIFIIYFFNL